MASPIILKLGGSIITHKSGSGSFSAKAVARLAQEIKRSGVKNLILIHGAGGTPHRLAKKFNLSAGAKTRSQITGSIATHLAVAEVGQKLSASLLAHKLPVLPLTTNTVFYADNGTPTLQAEELISQSLKLGLIPMLSGDMVMDSRLNFSILSGDTIAAILSDKFKAKKIVFATDVDGLFDKDPKTYKNAHLIEKLTTKALKEMVLLLPKTNRDATGEMLGKISKLLSSKNTAPVVIVNGLKRGRLYKALAGKPTIGTYIK